MAPLVKRNGKLGMAMLVGGWVEVRRFLATPIDPTQAQSLYLGFSLHRMNPFKFGEIVLGNSWQAVVDPALSEN